MKKLISILFGLLSASFSYSQLLFAAREKGTYGFVDIKGSWVIRQAFDNAHAFSDGLAAVMKSELWSYVDEEGKLITGFKYHQAFNFEGEVGRVRALASNMDSQSLFGLIDRKGNWVVKPSFSYIRKFSDNGLAMARNQDGNWGFIDKKGNWVIQPKYAGLKDFKDGLAMARSKGRWGYIDEKENWVIQPKYDHALNFSEGIAMVQTKKGWVLIDKHDNRIGDMVSEVSVFFRWRGRCEAISRMGSHRQGGKVGV